jgi:glycine oxidase
VKAFDVIIIGAGIIGVSLALELRRHGLAVLVLDRGQPGGEASTAGAGMLAASEVEGPPQLQELALRSAALYPDFVRQAETGSDLRVDFNRSGAIRLTEALESASLSPAELNRFEPALIGTSFAASFVEEDFVDARTLMPALVTCAKRQGVHIHGGSHVIRLLDGPGIEGVQTEQTTFHSGTVVNCAGAWAGEFGVVGVPVRPVKGHMLDLIPQRRDPVRHVIRHRELDIYLVPRRDGRVSVGSTLEEAGFDKRVDPDTIQRLHQSAADLVPELGEARIHASWAGLRPATPDKLPIMGPTDLSGYYISTGHYRNGILLAPASALALAELITGSSVTFDLTPFSPHRS